MQGDNRQHNRKHTSDGHFRVVHDLLSMSNEAVSKDAMRGKIVALEREMLKCQQVHIEPVHYFAKGLYAREITIPKGCLLTGKIHLQEHITMVLSGDISVNTDDGIRRIVAPAIFVTKPGMKRVGYAHEQTMFLTVHACELTDVEKIEDALVVDTFEQFERAIQDGAAIQCMLKDGGEAL